MTLEECEQEASQPAHMQGIGVSGIGFVCSGGFAFENENRFILDCRELYAFNASGKPEFRIDGESGFCKKIFILLTARG